LPLDIAHLPARFLMKELLFFWQTLVRIIHSKMRAVSRNATKASLAKEPYRRDLHSAKKKRPIIFFEHSKMRAVSRNANKASFSFAQASLTA